MTEKRLNLLKSGPVDWEYSLMMMWWCWIWIGIMKLPLPSFVDLNQMKFDQLTSSNYAIPSTNLPPISNGDVNTWSQANFAMIFRNFLPVLPFDDIDFMNPMNVTWWYRTNSVVFWHFFSETDSCYLTFERTDED